MQRRRRKGRGDWHAGSHLQKKETRGEVLLLTSCLSMLRLIQTLKIDVGDLAVVDFSAFEMNGKGFRQSVG